MSSRVPHAFVVSAPSGAGKTTLIRKLLPDHPELEFSISCTTRACRKGETEGLEYYYLNRDEFLQRMERGEFLEWEDVHGDLYGTLRSEIIRILDRGHYPLFDLDVKGALTLKKTLEHPHLIFITVPGPEEFLKRLKGRGTETEAQIATRLSRMELEMSHAGEFDYQVENGDLQTAVERVNGIIREILNKRNMEE